MKKSWVRKIAPRLAYMVPAVAIPVMMNGNVREWFAEMQNFLMQGERENTSEVYYSFSVENALEGLEEKEHLNAFTHFYNSVSFGNKIYGALRDLGLPDDVSANAAMLGAYAAGNLNEVFRDYSGNVAEDRDVDLSNNIAGILAFYDAREELQRADDSEADAIIYSLYKSRKADGIVTGTGKAPYYNDPLSGVRKNEVGAEVAAAAYFGLVALREGGVALRKRDKDRFVRKVTGGKIQNYGELVQLAKSEGWKRSDITEWMRDMNRRNDIGEPCLAEAMESSDSYIQPFSL